MPSFFFRELQHYSYIVITVFLLICDSYMTWSTRFVSLKLCMGFSIVDFVSFLLKLIFLLDKMHGLWLWSVIIPFKIKIIEKPHTVLFPDMWPLKLQQEVLKFSDICVSWSSAKPDLETIFWTYQTKVLRTSDFLNSNFK